MARLVPRSLRRQFALAFLGLAAIVVAGGGVAVQAVRELALSSRQLAEQRLNRVRVAQELVAETSAVSLDAYQLIAAGTTEEVRRIYAEMGRHLQAYEALVGQISSSTGDAIVLDLHQASQLLRNSANAATQLREDSLRTELQFARRLEDRIGQLEILFGREQLPLVVLLYQLGGVNQEDELDALRRRLVSHSVITARSTTWSAAAAEAMMSDVRALFALRGRLLEQRQVMAGLREEMNRQSQAMGQAAGAWSAASSADYLAALQRLVEDSERKQRWILALFIGSLVAAFALARLFLGRHVVGRLEGVSNSLRSARAGHQPLVVPVHGADEIGDMARAVEGFLEDRRQLALTRVSLEIEQHRLAAIIDHTADGILVVREGRVRQLNPAGVRMFGVEAGAEAAGLRLDGLLSGFVPPLAQAQAGARSAVGRRADGSTFPAEVSASEVGAADGGLVVLVVRDATLRRAVEQELTAARDAAVAARRAQTTFLANMSHELRTPLNGILGYTQVLRLDSSLDAEQRAGLKTIQSSGEHLLTLINDILDIAKIEAGKLELVLEPMDVASFLGVIGDLIRIKAGHKGLGFVLQVHGELPKAVHVDARRLRQVLLNVLGNAVKFTDAGQVRLDVHLLRIDAQQAQIRFEVSDTGIGMDAAQMQRLFQPFEQVGDVSRRAAGSGLGLSISRQLVRLMGSDIRLRSVPGEGSCFWFDLALAVLSSGAASARVEPVIVGYAGEKRSVLIVDDIAENREMLSYLLRLLGFRIDEAENGEVALERAQARRPDLILMDLMMPVLDGLEATRRMRRLEGLADVPIIGISASVSREDQERWMAAGGNAFEAKPVQRDSLLRSIGRLLGLQWVFEAGEGGAEAAGAGEAEPAQELLPPRDQLLALQQLSLTGNMAAIVEAAGHLLEADERHRPFAERVQRLAREYQAKALATLLKDSLARPP